MVESDLISMRMTLAIRAVVTSCSKGKGVSMAGHPGKALSDGHLNRPKVQFYAGK
jgi:hypothetical protein